jgi:hypothetical protein
LNGEDEGERKIDQFLAFVVRRGWWRSIEEMTGRAEI